VSGKLEFDLELPGEPAQRHPVALTRSLLEDPRPAVRRAALLGSNRAWEGVGDVLGASLNAIAGTRHTLYRNRGVAHFLDPALFDAGITRRTLDTMWDVVRARADVPRAYLARKAALLGRERLGFQDLMAPLPVANTAKISWEEARVRVCDAFGRFAPELESFAREAFDGQWIDYAPRPAKRPGGFCTGSSLIEQSRVFMTYNQTQGDVSTLAHELGHAFHSRVMRGLRPWARRYPMTLAETASTFAEQLVVDAVLSRTDASPEERAVMLDNRLQDAAMFLLNIWMRFVFETSFYEERRAGELGVARICELMSDAQRQCYGDALDPDELDPWFWASKLHFYITGLSFYNFPYTFGYLFSLGIFARAREEGAAFAPRYAELLMLTGSDSAENVARQALGVDLEKPDFWNASIDLIAADLVQLEALLPDVALETPES
jgi:pepF/M3 family oligoendopeptidase